MSTTHRGWKRAAPAIAAGCVAALVLAALPCQAGTIRHDRADSAYRSLALEPQFAAVGRYTTGVSSCSFTLIAPQWALTAAHCVDTDLDGRIDDESITDDTFTVGGVQRRAVEIHVPTDWNGNINRGFDLALVRLDAPITTVTPATIYTGFNELGAQIVSVGFGQGGTGKTGATGSSGIKRAGQNVVDRFAIFRNGATGLIWDFDEPSPRLSPNQFGDSTPLDLEMNIAPGDSGGGTFLFENGAWYLAGVHSGSYDYFDYPGSITDHSSYGDGSLVTRVSAYQSFIFSIIPEPASLPLLALTSLILIQRRPNTIPSR